MSVSCSVILEWDNPRLDNADASSRSLRALARELADVPDWLTVTELLVPFNSDAFERAALEAAVRASPLAATLTDHDIALRVVPGGDRHYYDLKNAAADEALGDLLVFVDSDVEPLDGWFRELVAPLADEGVQFTCGQTSTGPLDSWWDRSLSCFWLFPQFEDPTAPVHETDWFSANNFAVRASCFAEHRFRSQRDRFRGQCADLAHELQRDGIALLLTPGARTVHPPPSSFAKLTRRGFLYGAEWTRGAREGGRRGGRLVRGAARASAFRLRRDVRRVSAEHRAVGLGRASAGATLALALWYETLHLIGALAAVVRPGAGTRWH